MRAVSRGLRRLFLPRGPLPPDYVVFQFCDSLQAACSYLRGVLTLHATLTAAAAEAGSGEGAARVAVTLFSLKELSSHLASLLFSGLFAPAFDAEARFFRFFADCINNLGLTMELAAPFCGRHFFVVSCAANVCKALCGVAAGATRAAISSHFAGRGGVGNIAELQAKEGAQETAITAIGLLAGLALAPVLNATPTAQVTAFVVLTAAHTALNYWAVRTLQLRRLSVNRLHLLVGAWAAASGGGGAGAATPVLTPQQAAVLEPLLPCQYAEAVTRPLALALRCPRRTGYVVVVEQGAPVPSTARPLLVVAMPPSLSPVAAPSFDSVTLVAAMGDHAPTLPPGGVLLCACPHTATLFVVRGEATSGTAVAAGFVVARLLLASRIGATATPCTPKAAASLISAARSFWAAVVAAGWETDGVGSLFAAGDEAEGATSAVRIQDESAACGDEAAVAPPSPAAPLARRRAVSRASRSKAQ